MNGVRISKINVIQQLMKVKKIKCRHMELNVWKKKGKREK